MTLAAADFRIPGTITGTGRVLIVDHTTDNPLVTFRFTHAGVKMSAAEREFEAGGHRFAPGAFVVADDGGSRAAVERSIRELGLSAWAVDAAPSVPMHDLDVPRIGYVHTWTSTQDEGWVRLAFDNFKVPYVYFGAPKLREGNLREKYDVIVFPHAGQGGAALVTGGVQGNEPRPYKKTELTPNVGTVDSTDDMRGSIGIEGLMELYKFVDQGGVLITEGATSTVFPEYKFTPAVTVETPDNLYVRGSVLKTILGDKASPVLYGYDQSTLAVYFNQAPVMRVGGGGFGGGRGGGSNVPPVGNMQPNTAQPTLTTLDGPPPAPAAPGGGGGRGGRGGRGGGGAPPGATPVPAEAAAAGWARRWSWRRTRRIRRRSAGLERAPRAAVVSDQCQRPAVVRHPHRRGGADGPRRRDRCADRQGPRRDVREPSVLALADAGQLLPRLQRDPELERSRCGPGRLSVL